MTPIVRHPQAYMAVNGSTIAASISSARIRYGYDMRVAEATVVTGCMPAVNPWDEVAVTITLDPATEPFVTRFTGYYIGAERQLYPQQVTLNCRGKLERANQYHAITNVDMSSEAYNIQNAISGWGHTDQAMVSTILYICSLTASAGWVPSAESAYTGISGTGRLLGACNGGKGFNWDEGSTALSFIEELDTITNYRTYDESGGTIARTFVTTASINTSPSVIFTEGVDIFTADVADTTSGIFNKIKVNGWNGDKKENSGSANERTFSASNSSSPLIIGGSQWQAPMTISSRMLEYSTEAECPSALYYASGVPASTFVHGLSCEYVATWQLAEHRYGKQQLTLTTPRGDMLSPGDSIGVIAPCRLGAANASTAYWVQSVDVQMSDQGQFSQVLTCLVDR